ncbi:MAG: hypothetical protein CL483_12525 [Acidobacteria bacterium]|nr:hypothetical protein [Acidobacteriota bacterium]
MRGDGGRQQLGRDAMSNEVELQVQYVRPDTNRRNAPTDGSPDRPILRGAGKLPVAGRRTHKRSAV